jgi:hypothetical protein
VSCKCDAQATPEASKQSTESRSIDSTTQQQQSSQQAQPASWSAIAAQGAAKGTGSPPAVSSAPRSQSSGLGKRGSATDLRQEQVHRLPCAAFACLCEQQKRLIGIDGCLSSAQCASHCEDIPFVCALLPTQAPLNGRSQGPLLLAGASLCAKALPAATGHPCTAEHIWAGARQGCKHLIPCSHRAAALSRCAAASWISALLYPGMCTF